jgi:hypothetical protein
VVTESGVEVLKRLFEANLRRVQIAHRRGQPILGEVARLDIACLRDQLHRAHGRLVVSIREHIDVGVCHAFAVERARDLGEASVGQAAFVHERTERLSERLVARLLHGRLRIVLAFGRPSTRWRVRAER